MIEISFGKLLVLALIALIVLGPEKLPQAARTAGALVRRLRSSWDSVRAEVERELQVEEIRRTARESVARMDAAQAELDATLKQVREVASGVADSSSAPPAGGDRPGDHPENRADAADQPALTPASVTATGNQAATAGAGQPAAMIASNTSAAAGSDPATTAAASAASADTRTGDLFAGTASAAPPAAAAPAERVDGAA